MKKYLIIFLLLLNISTYSQTADSTNVWAARELWKSDINNWNQGQPMPNWDLDGNIIPFSILMLVLLTVLFNVVRVKKFKAI